MASNMLLDKLQKARGLKEPELLEMAIKDCKAAGIDDHEGVAKAETQLQVIRMKMSAYNQTHKQPFPTLF